MSSFPGTIRVRVITHDLPESVRTSIASSMMSKATPEKTVAFLNATAKRRGVNASYELATEAQYWAYRAELNARKG